MMMRNANDDRIDYDKPPFSRLFIVCSKQHTKEDLMPLFDKYGVIEDMHIPRDRNSGASKGIAFVKYNRTSSAAAAIQELHMKSIVKDGKPIKVMVSSHKSDGPYVNEEKFKRLFIKVPRTATENEITEHFSRFGEVTSVHLQRDKASSECRGFAYVNFNSFLDAAKAFEQCDTKYRPIFATPKDELKRPRDEFDHSYQNNYHNGMAPWRDDGKEFKNFAKDFDKRDTISSMIQTKSQNFDSINVTCSPGVQEKSLEQLFKIIPGMVYFRYSMDEFNDSKVLVKYNTEVAAAYAMESLNHYEFPSGEQIRIKPVHSPLVQAASNLTEIVNTFKNSKDTNPDMLQLAEAIAQASSLIKAATTKEKSDNTNDFEYIHGVKVPLPKPMADKNSRMVKRCFLVLKPVPPPHHILQNIFCRFGDLIDISVFPNKTFGFAKYASEKAADDAITTLHGVTLYGVHFKVIEADEKPSGVKEEKMNIDDESAVVHDVETKRAKFSQ